jgi:endonuclease/exonuclease/phosphatase family metal-dependent hydrolase
MTRLIRIATYNIHKCRGMDRRVSAARIGEVLLEIDADVIALQEILSFENAEGSHNQARFLAQFLRMELAFGENRRLRGGAYGNATLSRIPIIRSLNHDITWKGREARGCLQTDIKIHSNEAPTESGVLHIFNVHLGTAFLERRNQARLLLGEAILEGKVLKGPRLILGDFNEWTRGLASRLFAHRFEAADPKLHLSRARTYPGILPFLHLDHIYFDRTLHLRKLMLHRSRLAMLASDHLPLVADFECPN